jgi:hypothetical protein
MQDMIVAVTEPAAVALEWAMAELAGNPRVMAKVQNEIARVVAVRAAATSAHAGQAPWQSRQGRPQRARQRKEKFCLPPLT